MSHDSLKWDYNLICLLEHLFDFKWWYLLNFLFFITDCCCCFFCFLNDFQIIFIFQIHCIVSYSNKHIQIFRKKKITKSLEIIIILWQRQIFFFFFFSVAFHLHVHLLKQNCFIGMHFDSFSLSSQNLFKRMNYV